jgi:2-oxoglutarate ferredoxin oxidoreductase subunit alpha
LADEIIGHLRERADIVRDEGNCEIGIPDNLPENFKPFDMSGIYENNIAPLVPFGKGKIVRFSGSIYNEWGQTDNSPQNAARLARHLTEKIENNKDDIVTVRHFNNEDDIDVAIVAYGCTARAAMESVKQLRSEGIKAGLLQLVTIWPFADKYVTEICKASHAVIVPEMNLGQIVSEVKRCAGNTPVIPVNRLDGMMITPSEISMHVKEALQRWI